MVVKDAELLVRKCLAFVCMSAYDLLYVYVCMHVCMYVCMYVICMHTKTCVYMRGYIRMHVCLSISSSVFTCVDLYIYIYTGIL